MNTGLSHILYFSKISGPMEMYFPKTEGDGFLSLPDWHAWMHGASSPQGDHLFQE
jgi:hypothetical protein